MSNILVVAAHPDDEVIGCGGTIKKLKEEGHNIFIMILGEGITSRKQESDKKRIAQEIMELKDNSIKANKILGSEAVFFRNFPDNKFDSVPLLEIVQCIEEVKDKIQPAIVFTHFKHDLNIDHRITYQAVLTATRPMKDETVKEIYSFEVLSSTEWAFPTRFSPNVFYDISNTINDKLIALSNYDSELRDSSHPRSPSAIWNNARLWGQKMGVEYAEVFQCIRIIK